MAVNLTENLNLFAVPGIRLATAAAGIKKQGEADVTLIEMCLGTAVAAVFTQNRFCAAPVTVARQHMQSQDARACLINAGNANAGTGKPGIADATVCCQALASLLEITTEQVLPFSTGIIGERLPVNKITDVQQQCIAALSENSWFDAAKAIMTTDTVAKASSQQINIDGVTVTITGIAKGAGMIHPNMATLLAFIGTDAAIDAALLNILIKDCVSGSFNCITVDGDTSTNDACVVMATAQAQMAMIKSETSESYQKLKKAVGEVCMDLAQAIIRDAEGATKFITIEIVNGYSVAECRLVANTIALSPLVKTAFFASDPNWGRILAAIGRADIEQLDINAISIFLNDLCVFRHGALAEQYSEAGGQAEMNKDEIILRVDLAQGNSATRIWTSDLSHDYVRINAEYRT